VRVSVCIPTLDRIVFFREAFASVLAQTEPAFEIIVSDNSGDRVYGALVETVVEEERRAAPGVPVRLIHQPTRLPLPAHINAQIDAATGDAWAYLPDDDRWRPPFLSTMVRLLSQRPEAGFAFCDHSIIDEGGKTDREETERISTLFGRSGLPEGFIPHDGLFSLALAGTFALQATVFRKEVIDAFRFEPGNLTFEWDVLLRMTASERDFGAVYCSERMVEVRFHRGQFGAPQESAARSMLRSLDGVAPVPKEAKRAYRRRRVVAYSALAGSLTQQGRRWEAARSLLAGLRTDPFYRPTYRQLALAWLPKRFIDRVRAAVRQS